MANWYVYSGAAGTGTGADWTNACTTLTLALALAGYAAGDTFYVAHDHAESTAAAITLTFKGTPVAPDRVICVDRAGTVPPVSADLRTTGQIITTGASSITLAGIAAGGSPVVYIDGLIIKSGTSGVAGLSCTTSGFFYFKNSAIKKLSSTLNTSAIAFTSSASGSPSATVILDNTTLEFGATGDTVSIRSGVEFIWKNTAAAIAGAVFPTGLFNSATTSIGSTFLLDGVDLSALSGKSLFTSTTKIDRVRLVNCKLPSSFTIGPAASQPRGFRAELVNCDSGAVNYRQEIYDFAGTLTAETVIVRTGGASDGTTPISHKIATTANAKALAPFESFPLAIWNDTTGSAKTLSVEIINDGLTLTNAEAWVEVEYLGSSATPLASLGSSGVADVLAAGANIPTSSETWTTTGLTTPVKQTMSVTFTPQMKGFVRAVVKIARASKTVYVCPKLTVV